MVTRGFELGAKHAVESNRSQSRRCIQLLFELGSMSLNRLEQCYSNPR